MKAGFSNRTLVITASIAERAGRIAAIVKYSDELEPLRELGADAVFHVADEAGTAFADDAVAGVDDSRTVQGA